MLTFLFWNLKQGNEAVIVNLVKRHRVDILILAESKLLPAKILEAINKRQSDFFYLPCDCAKIQIYTRFSEEHLLPLMAENHEILKGDDFTVRRLELSNREKLLLCAVHFPSKLRQAPIDQVAFTVRFAEVLNEAEKVAGHHRTILVGDLNMNPYEDGVVFTAGLHAVMSRRLAMKLTRKVKFESNRFFYNPMWSHFGEKKQGHAGTYYFANPKSRADYWNIYDQVLIRPDLLPFFRDEDLSIIWRDTLGRQSLLSGDGITKDEEISDHLPILFRLHI